MSQTTLTYIHPTVGKVQHNVVELHSSSAEGTHFAIVFTDDRKRKLSFQTNQPYVFRIEEKLSGYVETDNMPTKPFSATSSAPDTKFNPPPPPAEPVVAAVQPVRVVTP